MDRCGHSCNQIADALVHRAYVAAGWTTPEGKLRLRESGEGIGQDQAEVERFWAERIRIAEEGITAIMKEAEAEFRKRMEEAT